jgi:hypothetical protein
MKRFFLSLPAVVSANADMPAGKPKNYYEQRQGQ